MIGWCLLLWLCRIFWFDKNSLQNIKLQNIRCQIMAKIKEITFRNPPGSNTMELGVRHVFIGDEKVGVIKHKSWSNKYEFTPCGVNFLSRCNGSEGFILATITEETNEMLGLYFDV